MNFSLGILAALYLLLPGVTFAFGFERTYDAKRVPSPLENHFPKGLAIALLVAMIFDALWFKLWSQTITSAPDAGQYLALMGIHSDPDTLRRLTGYALDSVRTCPLHIAAYFSGLPIATWFAGWIGGNVWSRIRPPALNANWYQLLKPKEPAAVVWLTTEVHLDGQCYLFTGLLDDFSVGSSGDLERVVLKFAARRLMDALEEVQITFESGRETANSDHGDGNDSNELPDGWRSIPGEFVVVKMKESSTVNLDYFYDIESSYATANGGASSAN